MLPIFDERQVAVLTASALSHLWVASPDSHPDNEGCCPLCCAPCGVLKELADTDELETWLAGWPCGYKDTYWWDEKNARVDRAWLARSWSGKIHENETAKAHEH